MPLLYLGGIQVVFSFQRAPFLATIHFLDLFSHASPNRCMLMLCFILKLCHFGFDPVEPYTELLAATGIADLNMVSCSISYITHILHL